MRSYVKWDGLSAERKNFYRIRDTTMIFRNFSSGKDNHLKVSSSILMVVFSILFFLVFIPSSQAQSEFDEDTGDTTAIFPGPLSDVTNCTLNVLNRSIPFVPGNKFNLPNVPADAGFLRARVTCVKPDGMTLGGQSAFFVPTANSMTAIEQIKLGVVEPIPTSLAIAAPTTTLNFVGATTQLTVTGTFPNGFTRDLTAQSTGTSHTTSNPAIATVTPDGLVTAFSSGTAVISARNEGVLAAILITVVLPNDADGDGLPDDYERAHACLNPNVPDANADPDGDGLTNLREFQIGTDPCVADTDGDGLSDGEEIARGTNPLNPDTDFDGLIDGLEIAFGSNPLNPDSDGDGLPDGVEVALVGNPTGANPFADNDGDGLTNLDEIRLFTDPRNPDTDGDGVSDGQEVLRGCDPLVAELTTVVGRTLDQQGNPVAGAHLQVIEQTGRTGLANTQGRFTITITSACVSSIQVVADAKVGSRTLRGQSAAVRPVVGGVTDVGDIVLKPLEGGPLYPGPKFATDGSPISVVVADVNADGKPDLITANGSNTVSVLLGKGDGTFQAQQRLSNGFRSPFSVAVADFNADGVPDIVTANRFSNDVSVFFGNGDGTFQPQQRVAVDGTPVSVALMDLDADGILDIVTANRNSADVSVLFGNGDGTFKPPQLFAVGLTPASVAVADVNGDGAPDIVTSNTGTSDVSVLLHR